ncbi:MAG: bifunctional 2-polyprenyl-6-hydroxyphenol methylase/3-demethylubiquinol 3-O-methyltransferase UbiG [Xanthomonadales bacterium]|nr:bifunctional 2-polyprenyl-6-hydroxyphenol methylase/3-demethylubiquinol 3-O-methyltransferase UbiG [Xanthomonadales bacterium]
MSDIRQNELPEAASVDPREVEHYRRFAATWWDPQGPFWPLHKLNDLRVPWITTRLCRHFDRDPAWEQPLQGLALLDIGCGGGILAESMARLGADVHGIDVVDRNIAVASDHARGQGLSLRYELVTAEALLERGPVYDAVLNMEVVEHVADLPGFMSAACGLLKPEGMMFVATINRNPLAWLFAIFGAEVVLRWLPRGTHRYRLLRKPSEIFALLERHDLQVLDSTGVRVDPLRRSLHLCRSLRVNYMLSAARAGVRRSGAQRIDRE